MREHRTPMSGETGIAQDHSAAIRKVAKGSELSDPGPRSPRTQVPLLCREWNPPEHVSGIVGRGVRTRFQY